jgi:DNA polymerase-4
MRCIGHVRISDAQESIDTISDLCSEVSPLVEPRKKEIFVDLSGSKGLWRELWRQLVKSERGRPSLGVSTSKLVARIASKEAMTGQNRLCLIKPGEEGRFLKNRPLEELWLIDDRNLEILRQLGLTRIGQLTRLPDAFLREHFGTWGYLLKDWSRGIDSSPVKGLSPPSSIKAGFSFEHPGASDLLYLQQTVRQGVEEIHRNLAGRACREISLKLKGERQVHQIRRLTTHYVTKKKQIERELLRLLDSLTPAEPVQELEIEVKRLHDLRLIQGDLFTPSLQMSTGLSEAVDNLQEKFGMQALCRGSALNGSRRERFLMLLERLWQG